MDTRAKITSKGQVTIPKAVRDALEWAKDSPLPEPASVADDLYGA